MAVGKADRRYAKALFSLAGDQGHLDPVSQDMARLASLLDQSPELSSFMSHPLIPGNQRTEALGVLFDGKAHPLTLHFLQFLDDQGRLGHLQGICESFESLYNEHVGIVRVSIVSAAAMQDDQVLAIKSRLAEKLGKTIEADTKVDASLIGGFRVQIEGRMIDQSISTKLTTFKRQLINA
jgi:F-type H+-transporting ATPase subunit delta